MRARRLLGLAAIIALASMSAAAKPACTSCGREDVGLRLNQIQFVGTGESYKQVPSDSMLSLIRMGGKKGAQALDFGEPPLAAQLDAGARALSFDVAYDPKGGLFRNPVGASMAGELLDADYVAQMSQPGFKVIHVLDVDFHSSCLTLKACLGEVASWSRAHPDHMPIIITLRTNDVRTPMPGSTKPQPFDAAAFDALDDDIRSVFRRGEMILPAEVKGRHATLREAVMAGDWPKLGVARGKVIFVLDDSAAKIALYSGPANTLDNRPMFVTTDEASPLASFIAIDDPVRDTARIAADVKAGFIVRTRADDEAVEARLDDTRRREAAFASGAQIIATDFLVPDRKIGTYQVSITDPRHVLCDRLAAMSCAAWTGRVVSASAR